MKDDSSRGFYIGLARAGGGSILFILPMLMTMEMWWLGFSMDPLRLALMLIVSIPLLTGLAYYSGFMKRLTVQGAIVDAMVAIAVGAVTAGFLLAILAIVRVEQSLQEVVGKITVQAIPGAIGAVLASSQMGKDVEEKCQGHDGDTGKKRGYFGEVFLMVAGALFFAFSIAPTEEMVVIAHGMSAWHTMILIVASIGIMHAFVYSVDFRGQEARLGGRSWWSVFSRFTIVGYAIALGVSFYCLWSFGRNDGDDSFMVLT